MELSLLTFSMMRERAAGRLNADSLIRIAADCGIRSVDIMKEELVLYGKKQVREAMEKYGVSCGCLIVTLPFYTHPGRVPHEARKALKTAEELGCGILMVVPGGGTAGDVRAVKRMGREAAGELAAAHFREILALAEPSGIRIGFENTPQAYKPLASAEETERLLEQVPGLGLIFDTGNFRVADPNCDEREILERLKSRIIRVHVKDTVIGSFHGRGERCRDGQRMITVTPGSGVIPVRELLLRLKDEGYTGGLALEYAAKEGIHGPAHAGQAAIGAEYIRSVLDGSFLRAPCADIPGIPIPVSRIFFGTGMDAMSHGKNVDALLDALLSFGINAFDTARGYGLAEKSLGGWIRRRNNRHRIVILSKCGNVGTGGRVRVDGKVIRRELRKSLKMLGTDYIDIYLLHRDDPETPVSEIIDTLNEAKRAGKIRIFGVSNWTDARIREANAYAASAGLEGFSASSPNYGLAVTKEDPWGGECVSIAGPENAAARAWYEKVQMPVIAYSSLGRGFFSGKFRSGDYEAAAEVLDAPARKGYLCRENMERLERAEELAEAYSQSVPQIAMRYVFSGNMNLFAVVNTKEASRMKENIEAACHPLSEADRLFLEGVRERENTGENGEDAR